MDVAEAVGMDEKSDELHFKTTDRELLLLVRRDVRYMREEIEKVQVKLDQTAPMTMFRDHEVRLRILENFRWWILGGGAGAAFIGGALAHFFFH